MKTALTDYLDLLYVIFCRASKTAVCGLSEITVHMAGKSRKFCPGDFLPPALRLRLQNFCFRFSLNVDLRSI